MTRRRINLQDVAEVKTGGEPIDALVRELGTADMGFSPTDQVIYEINLNRIKPDPAQPRSFLPHDLKQKLHQDEMTPSEILQELLARAEHGNQLSTLILGGRPAVTDEEDAGDDDKGLLTLAQSIREVGLRQPINVYSVARADKPGERFYQIGEGERRYWAHHLLVLQGHQSFNRVRAIIETMPADAELVQRRQQAENAARQDLSAIARARAIQQIRDRLMLKLGTRVPNETTIQLPGQRELDEAVGQEVKAFAGRAIGDRMVRNYLRLLKLSATGQDLAEAAQLTEKQLRPVLRLESEAEQESLILKIINEKLSGRLVLSEVVTPASPLTSLRQVARTTVEERLEKRLLQAATTAHEVFSLGEEAYAAMVQALVGKTEDRTTRTALLSMRRLLDDLVQGIDDSRTGRAREIALALIAPPVDYALAFLPEAQQKQLLGANPDGSAVIRLMRERFALEPQAAAGVAAFWAKIEPLAQAIRTESAGTPVTVRPARKLSQSDVYTHEVADGAGAYWAYVFLVEQGAEAYRTIKAVWES